MKKQIKISIVIRTFNHRKLLERILKKIKTQKKIHNYEIVVVDSSSKDGTKELAIKEGCRVISLDPKNFSHPHALNLGAKNTKGEIILFASVDVIPKDTFWAYNLIKHFEDKKVGAVYGRQEPVPDFNPIEEFKLKKMFPDKKNSVASFSNASGALRKKLWEKIKYNEDVPYQYIGGEDQQLISKIKEEGYKIIYEPKSSVFHSHKYSLKMNIYQAYMNGKNQKEVEKWNKEVVILNYSKLDLVKYLIKRKKFRTLLFNLLFGGILIRIAFIVGKINTNS